MNDKLPHQALWALSELNKAGFEAFLVGGCVRDLLMGREPGDFDITTSATPEQVEAVFAGERIIETGLRHGTVTVLREGLPLEITTYRRDLSYSDHRHPDAVCFTPRLEDDLARRDFTVNAMAWHPDLGLVDCFNGQADLKNRVIRCVGEPERRFDEDALRILRALRFASTLDFSIHPDTAAAALAQRQLLEHVSRERIAAELTKLLCGPSVERVVNGYWPILAVPVPELGAMAGLDQRSKYHCYDVLAHSAAACAAVQPDRLTRWAALLHDVGKPACFTLDADGTGHFYGHAKVSARLAEEILTRLRFDKDTIRRVTQLTALHDYPIDPPEESAEKAVKKLLNRLGEADFFRLLDLKRGDSLAHAPAYRGRAAVCDRLEALARELIARDQCVSLKTLAVKGGDLLALGMAPGPAMGRLLDQLLEAVLNGEAKNQREALLALAKQLTIER